MNNFSTIGFDVSSERDFHSLIGIVSRLGNTTSTSNGIYINFSDPSGAELWVQLNTRREIIGANPHFKGISKRKVCLTNYIDRPESELDGAFYCWADPQDENNPESGFYPFVFDSPDFRTIAKIHFPTNCEIQLTGFAREIEIYENEREFAESQSEPAFASQSFIPSGLFSPGAEKDPDPPQAFAIFAGLIKEYERKKNELAQKEFHWFLVDTLGGEVDVVADTRILEKEPVKGGILFGQFWLSGQIINPGEITSKKTGFFKKIFGK